VRDQWTSDDGSDRTRVRQMYARMRARSYEYEVRRSRADLLLCPASSPPPGDKYSAEAGKPKLNGGQICFKFVLLSLNVLFLIFGCVLMGVGSYALNNQVGAIAGQTVPMGLIVLGVFIMLLAILGALSAWRESRAFLGLYFAFLLLFTIILFAVGIAVYVKKNDADWIITEAWNDGGKDVQLSLQNALDCCGLKTVNDTGYGCPANIVPATAATCLPIMVDQFNGSFLTAGACGIAFSVIMLAGLVFVCYLMTGIKRKQEEQDIAKLRTGGDQVIMGTLDEEQTQMEEETV
jgi:hypothetical protein